MSGDSWAVVGGAVAGGLFTAAGAWSTGYFQRVTGRDQRRYEAIARFWQAADAHWRARERTIYAIADWQAERDAKAPQEVVAQAFQLMHEARRESAQTRVTMGISLGMVRILMPGIRDEAQAYSDACHPSTQANGMHAAQAKMESARRDFEVRAKPLIDGT